MHLARLQLSPPMRAAVMRQALHTAAILPMHTACRRGLLASINKPHQLGFWITFLSTLLLGARLPSAGILWTHHRKCNRCPRAQFRTAIKRMHADLQALLRHGEDLGIDSDPIRVSHAYNAHLGAVFAGRAEHSCDEQHASTPTLQLFSNNLAPAALPHATHAVPSVAANFATSSGLSISTSAGCSPSSHHNRALSSSVPQLALNSFDGIDPNGSDAFVGRPAKQQRLR